RQVVLADWSSLLTSLLLDSLLRRVKDVERHGPQGPQNLEIIPFKINKIFYVLWERACPR
ncbi:hypothetical protein ACI2KC_21065, partial [Pseudomonas monteilii]